MIFLNAFHCSYAHRAENYYVFGTGYLGVKTDNRGRKN
jgi:hypothetical protein